MLEERYPQWGMAQLRAGAALINLVDIGRSRTAPGRFPRRPAAATWIISAWRSARHDEQALRGHLAAHGIEIVEESLHAGARGESLSIYVRDPSGNVARAEGAAGAMSEDCRYAHCKTGAAGSNPLIG